VFAGSRGLKYVNNRQKRRKVIKNARYHIGCPLSSPFQPLLSSPFQDELRPCVPTVLGNLEYRRFRSQPESIDHLLRDLGVERRFVETALSKELAKREAEAKQTGKRRILCYGDQILLQKNAAVALQCSILRTLTGESYRGLAQTLAER
jgi:hypothetical protein